MRTPDLSASATIILRRPARLGWFAASLALASVHAVHADVTLSGRVGPSIIGDNVVIERGERCILNGTVIKGNVTLQPGARLVAHGATIEGDVKAASGAWVDLRSRTKVSGDVQGTNTRRVLAVQGTDVSGNIQIISPDPPRGGRALKVLSANVAGDVQVNRATGHVGVVSSKIHGDIQLTANQTGPYTIHNNRVDGDIQVNVNKGRASVIANRVNGNLEVLGNTPRPIVRRNIVEGTTEVD